MTYSFNFPIVISTSGLQPQDPQNLRDQLTAAVESTNPGYTNDLPGGLIEDIASTDVGAMVMVDQAKVEAVNSLTPYGANDFTLGQLAQIYGVPYSTPTNTSVPVTFAGTIGYVIADGFLVSDGTYTYAVQTGGVITSSGYSDILTAVAVNTGSWAVPVGTVTQLLTSVPASITLSVTNNTAGTPGQDAETPENFRARVLQAGLASGVGTARFTKTMVTSVYGVTSRLVAVKKSGTDWQVIVGGNGDNYAIGWAILQGVMDPTTLTGSSINVTAFTAANPGQVTTDITHGYVTGESVTIAGVTPSAYNATYTVTVIDEHNFTVGVDTSSYGAYTSGGVCTPNSRNVTVTLNDYPDSYDVNFIIPRQQTVTMTVTWNSPGFTNGGSFQQLVAQPLADYINSISAGAPINVMELNEIFKLSVQALLDPVLLTRLVFSIYIDGTLTPEDSGYYTVTGDPYSYLTMSSTGVTVVQG